MYLDDITESFCQECDVHHGGPGIRPDQVGLEDSMQCDVFTDSLKVRRHCDTGTRINHQVNTDIERAGFIQVTGKE